MKILNSTLLLLFSFSIISCLGTGPSSTRLAKGEPPAIIPLPKEVVWGDSLYLVPEDNIICYGRGSKKSAVWLEELLSTSGKNVELVEGISCGNWHLSLDASLEPALGEEGYKLKIDKDGVEVKAAKEAGLFYGIQTLRQMFPAEVEGEQPLQKPVYLRYTSIEDKPHFEWRGTMVDVARSFFGLDYLKRHIDRMALYKLNRLHLHLTDDQGWRIEIKNRPKLTEVGSKGSVKGGNSGFLTQEEYKELQEYALDRKIVIVPEVDMPGHIYAALVAYPELNCEDFENISPRRATPPELYRGYKVGWSRLCLENPRVYDFVSDVIGELSKITEGPWIHIGGDEIKHPLYEEFVLKADSIVQAHGKTAIGWEEVTKAPVSDSLISQQWHGTVEGVVEPRTIESLCSHFYLDHANVPGQENTLNWCKEDGVSLKDVYSFRSQNKNSIGVEAPVWTEHVLNQKMLDDRFWPRALAVAEIGWSLPEKRDFTDFIDRAQAHAERLRKMGIHHFPTPEINWEKSEIAEEPSAVFEEFYPLN